MTFGCARCHDHKLESVTTEDYYALAGIFGSTVSVHRETGWRSNVTWNVFRCQSWMSVPRWRCTLYISSGLQTPSRVS
jgi:hypothetical protein